MPSDASISPQRTMEFDEPSNAYIVRDGQSVVHAILHNQRPVLINAVTAREAAKSYVHAHVELLGLDPSQLGNLDRPINKPALGGRSGGEPYPFTSSTCRILSESLRHR
jgi:hypothetical protein